MQVRNSSWNTVFLHCCPSVTWRSSLSTSLWSPLPSLWSKWLSWSPPSCCTRKPDPGKTPQQVVRQSGRCDTPVSVLLLHSDLNDPLFFFFRQRDKRTNKHTVSAPGSVGEFKLEVFLFHFFFMVFAFMSSSGHRVRVTEQREVRQWGSGKSEDWVPPIQQIQSFLKLLTYLF